MSGIRTQHIAIGALCSSINWLVYTRNMVSNRIFQQLTVSNYIVLNEAINFIIVQQPLKTLLPLPKL